MPKCAKSDDVILISISGPKIAKRQMGLPACLPAHVNELSSAVLESERGQSFALKGITMRIILKSSLIMSCNFHKIKKGKISRHHNFKIGKKNSYVLITAKYKSFFFLTYRESREYFRYHYRMNLLKRRFSTPLNFTKMV